MRWMTWWAMRGRPDRRLLRSSQVIGSLGGIPLGFFTLGADGVSSRPQRRQLNAAPSQLLLLGPGRYCSPRHRHAD